MTQLDLTLSENAARRIKAIAETEGRPLMLRVAVDGGGCSGFQYRFDLVETIEDDDLKVERDGAAVAAAGQDVRFASRSSPARASADARRS